MREHERLRALIHGDEQLADKLHAPDYQLITPDGLAFSKADYLDAIATGRLRYLVFEVEDDELMSIVPGRDLYAVRYVARIQVEVEGHRSDLLRVWHTDLYRLTPVGWQAYWSQATLISG